MHPSSRLLAPYGQTHASTIMEGFFFPRRFRKAQKKKIAPYSPTFAAGNASAPATKDDNSPAIFAHKTNPPRRSLRPRNASRDPPDTDKPAFTGPGCLSQAKNAVYPRPPLSSSVMLSYYYTHGDSHTVLCRNRHLRQQTYTSSRKGQQLQQKRRDCTQPPR